MQHNLMLLLQINYCWADRSDYALSCCNYSFLYLVLDWCFNFLDLGATLYVYYIFVQHTNISILSWKYTKWLLNTKCTTYWSCTKYPLSLSKNIRIHIVFSCYCTNSLSSIFYMDCSSKAGPNSFRCLHDLLF